MERKKHVWASMAATVMMTGGAFGATILNDDFSSYWRNTANGTSGGTFSSGYSNDAVRTAWNNGGLYYGSSSTYDTSATPAYMSANNRVAYRDFATPITADSDWSVSFKMYSTSYSRVQRVVLANYTPIAQDTGNQGTFSGYAAMWNLGTADTAGSEGSAQIRKYADGSSVTDASFNNTGSSLGSAQSGHIGADGDDPAGGDDALDLPMSQWLLTWTAATHTLTLSVDGTIRLTVTSETTSVTPTFNRIYLIGNNNGFFDDILVTGTPIPEPASGAMIASGLFAGGILTRRLIKNNRQRNLLS